MAEAFATGRDLVDDTIVHVFAGVPRIDQPRYTAVSCDGMPDNYLTVPYHLALAMPDVAAMADILERVALYWKSKGFIVNPPILRSEDATLDASVGDFDFVAHAYPTQHKVVIGVSTPCLPGDGRTENLGS